MDGIINVYKEAGYTSFDVVAKLRGILKTKKIGHTGTLDPQATGVLPVCVGRATKLCELLLEKEKVYEAVFLPGVITDTEDLTGTVLERRTVNLTKEELCEVAESFLGDYDQIPPMYSALKVNGQKLCNLARSGKEIERNARRVEIYENTVLSCITEENGNVREAVIRVRCSKGTYIRTLLSDMGNKLGCGACMKALKRTAAGPFAIEDAVLLSDIEKMRDLGRLDEILQPIDHFLSGYPAITIKEEYERFLYNGNKLTWDMLQAFPESKEGKFRVYDTSGCLIGFYELNSDDGVFHSVKMFLP